MHPKTHSSIAMIFSYPPYKSNVRGGRLGGRKWAKRTSPPLSSATIPHTKQTVERFRMGMGLWHQQNYSYWTFGGIKDRKPRLPVLLVSKGILRPFEVVIAVIAHSCASNVLIITRTISSIKSTMTGLAFRRIFRGTATSTTASTQGQAHHKCQNQG